MCDGSWSDFVLCKRTSIAGHPPSFLLHISPYSDPLRLEDPLSNGFLSREFLGDPHRVAVELCAEMGREGGIGGVLGRLVRWAMKSRKDSYSQGAEGVEWE